MFYVVLNEEVIEPPYPTAEAAREAAKRLAARFEAMHGRPAHWVIAPMPKPH